MDRFTIIYDSTWGYPKRVVFEGYDLYEAVAMLLTERSDVARVTSIWARGERL